MSTDRELLEAAARAAGYGAVQMWHQKPAVMMPVRNSGHRLTHWDPLADDGDALRLAVKLGMTLDTRPDAGFSDGIRAGCDPRTMAVEKNHADPYASIRRAIVRAAASLATKDAP